MMMSRQRGPGRPEGHSVAVGAERTCKTPLQATGPARGWARQAFRPRQRLAALLIVLGAGSAIIIAVGAVLVTHNWASFMAPSSNGVPPQWTEAQSTYFGVALVSLLLGAFGGLWLWWRAPRIGTGRWLWFASICLGLSFVGLYWPSTWGQQFWLALYLYRPALAMVLLGWPTARPSPRARKWIFWWFVIVVLTFTTTYLFMRTPASAGWPPDPLTPFDVVWVGWLFFPLESWALVFLPEVALAAVLVRRLRGLPPGARRLLLPVTVTGVAVFLSDVVTGLVGIAPAALTWEPPPFANHVTVVGAVILALNYAQLALAAVGIMIAFGARQRAVRSEDRTLRFDLERAEPVRSPTTALRHLLLDPTARVVYPGPHGGWIDSEGEKAEIGLSERAVAEVVGDDGTTLAGIDTDRNRAVHPKLVEIAAATVLGSLQNDRAKAEASARLGELQVVQFGLVDAIDRARQSFETDLHDGAQQRLVGLALAARLSARDGDEAARAMTLDEVRRASEEMMELLKGGVPVVLQGGLAEALGTLAAACVLPTAVRTQGDLQPADPLAKTMWMVASEAVANAEKHSGASRLGIDLRVDPQTAVLRVTDNGRGGVPSPPRSILRRVEDASGWVTVTSPLGSGTNVVAMWSRLAQALSA
jgi:signal transduction histidine kinase